jgi:hypothetical protein
MSFFQCASNGTHIDTRACARGDIAVPGRGCVPRASAAMTCAGKVMKGYGVCDVSFIGGPDVAAMAATVSPQSGRRLVEVASALEVAHAGMASQTAVGSNQTGWEPWQNSGRNLNNFLWHESGYVISGDIRNWRVCTNQGNVNVADQLGCFNKAQGKPLKQLAGWGNWPSAPQSRAGAEIYNKRHLGAGCWCAFKHACPNFLSARCRDVLRI